MKEMPSCTHAVSRWNINSGCVARKAVDPEQKRFFLDTAVKRRQGQAAAESSPFFSSETHPRAPGHTGGRAKAGVPAGTAGNGNCYSWHDWPAPKSKAYTDFYKSGSWKTETPGCK